MTKSSVSMRKKKRILYSESFPNLVSGSANTQSDQKKHFFIVTCPKRSSSSIRLRRLYLSTRPDPTQNGNG